MPPLRSPFPYFLFQLPKSNTCFGSLIDSQHPMIKAMELKLMVPMCGFVVEKKIWMAANWCYGKSLRMMVQAWRIGHKIVAVESWRAEVGRLVRFVFGGHSLGWYQLVGSSVGGGSLAKWCVFHGFLFSFPWTASIIDAQLFLGWAGCGCESILGVGGRFLQKKIGR